MQRISKFIAQSGICSRRDAECLITQGKVSVNDIIVTELSFMVSSEDTILIDGKKLSNKVKPKIWLYHKPRGVLVSHKDPKKRPTVFELIDLEHYVMSVGRLDFNTEGLLILTNSSKFVHHLESPKSGFKRLYKVRVYGKIDVNQIKKLEQGTIVKGVVYKPSRITKILDRGTRNSWLEIEISEGKNREIHQLMGSIGLKVSRLIRISYGPFHLGNIPVGGLRLAKNFQHYLKMPGLSNKKIYKFYFYDMFS